MAETNPPPLSARGEDASGTAGAPAPDAPRAASVNYEALRFPGCQPIPLTRDEFEDFDDRLEYWDARTGTAWVVADKYGVHEGTSRRLPHLAERIASMRGTPIVSYGSVTLLVRDADGRPQRAMEADETLYLHPTRAATPVKSLIIGENDFPDVVLEVDHTTDVRPGKLLVYEAWGFPELWVVVPPAGATLRRPAGVTIHRLVNGRYRSEPTSGVAEVELNVMTRQCLNRRIDSLKILHEEVAAWQAFRDRIPAKVTGSSPPTTPASKVAML